MSIKNIIGSVLFDEIMLFFFLIFFLIKSINSFSYYYWNYKYLTLESLVDLLLLLFSLADLGLFQYIFKYIEIPEFDSWLINLFMHMILEYPYHLAVSKLFVLLSIIVVVLLSINFLLETLNNYIEYSFLILFFLLSSFFFLSSFDLISMYLSIEGISLALYILIALNYTNNSSIEASVKYFFLGMLSSSFIIYGVSLIYGIFGFTNFLRLKRTLSFLSLNNKNYLNSDLKFLIELNSITNFTSFNYNLIILKVALILILFGFFFKLSAFPCSLWVPDVYEGSQLHVMFFLSTTVKITIFLFFFRLFFYTFSFFFTTIYPFILISAFGSILFGNLCAVLQKKLKRFIAYTSIFQIGFMMLSLSCNSLQGFQSFFIYLLFYFISNIIIFGILLHVKCFISGSNLSTIFDLKYFFIYNCFESILFSISVFSISGIPPLAGFFSKYMVLLSFFGNTYFFLTLILFFMNGVSMFYYIRLLKNLFFEIKNWLEFFISNKLFLFYSCIIEVKIILIVSSLFLIFFAPICFNFIIYFSIGFIESFI